MPNYFVDRDSSDNHQELSNINLLAADLDDDEAYVLNMPSPAWTPTMNDEHTADFSGFDFTVL